VVSAPSSGTFAMSSVQPFKFEPERNDREEITQNALENEEDQMDEEERLGQNSWCVLQLLGNGNAERERLLQRAPLSVRSCSR